VSPPLALSLLLGGALGAGLWLIAVRIPVMRRVRFVDRIAPSLRAADIQSRLLTPQTGPLTPFVPLERIIRPLLVDAVGWLNKFNPASTVLAKRLVQAGTGQSVMEFRAQQLLWSAAGLAGATIGIGLSSAAGRANVLFGVVVVLACGAGGFVARDLLLSSRIRKREARMIAEFPSLAELMALAVSAGESATGALERICRTANGDLAGEFSRVLAETRAGMPLIEALQEFSWRTQLAPLARFVDGLTVAVQRGTPLADVLRAQAQDVRDMAKRELMESAGRKEIAMMVPLVFGVLPLTVLFAVYPGLALINLGF
jgi:tight adherence protein C